MKMLVSVDQDGLTMPARLGFDPFCALRVPILKPNTVIEQPFIENAKSKSSCPFNQSRLDRLFPRHDPVRANLNVKIVAKTMVSQLLQVAQSSL